MSASERGIYARVTGRRRWQAARTYTRRAFSLSSPLVLALRRAHTRLLEAKGGLGSAGSSEMRPSIFNSFLDPRRAPVLLFRIPM